MAGLSNARRIVVKIGSSTLTHEDGHLNLRRIETLVKVLSDFKNAGRQVILVDPETLQQLIPLPRERMRSIPRRLPIFWRRYRWRFCFAFSFTSFIRKSEIKNIPCPSASASPLIPKKSFFASRGRTASLFFSFTALWRFLSGFSPPCFSSFESELRFP